VEEAGARGILDVTATLEQIGERALGAEPVDREQGELRGHEDRRGLYLAAHAVQSAQ
jgi:hypothetical protein